MAFASLVDGYIRNELIVILPVLYLLGKVLSKTKLNSDRVPIILFVVSLVVIGCYLLSLCAINTLLEFYAWVFAVAEQGVLLTGGSLFVAALWKNIRTFCPREDEDSSQNS